MKAGISGRGPMAAAILFALSLLGAILMAALNLGGVISVEGLGYFLPLVMLTTLVANIIYWLRIDEPSREAHKFAFFWGAGFALTAIALIGGELMFLPGFRRIVQGWIESWIAFTRGILGDEPAAVGFYVGFLASAIVLFLGYLVVWIGWWAAQRIGTKSD